MGLNTNDFIRKLADILDISHHQINQTTNLRELEGFDSIAIITIIAFVDEELGLILPPEEFGAVTTVNSLMQLIGLEHFA